MKKLIVCCDGTWNEPGDDTNVVKMFRALLPSDADGHVQVVYYDAGVGSGALPGEKLLAGVTGYGISRNIQEAYRFIANNYESDTRIYCFGFSRGAYTVRALGGLVRFAGLLTKTDLEKLPWVYALYRTHPDKRPHHRHYRQVEEILSRVREAGRNPSIYFMGVWDTVGALGVPTPLLGEISRKWWVGFFDVSADNIDYAYHAIAIDERRGPFKPSIWSNAWPGCRELKQVWFPGVHANVGGGYADSGLSDVAFGWMARMARERGLAFDQSYMRQQCGWRDWNDYGDPLGRLENSFTKPYEITSNVLKRLEAVISPVYDVRNRLDWAEYVRPIGSTHHMGVDKGRRARLSGMNERIHQSAVERLHYPGELRLARTYNGDHLKRAVEDLPVEPY